MSARITNTKNYSLYTPAVCYLEEMRLKAEFQKLQNIYFLKNIYKIKIKFIFNYIIKKIYSLTFRKSYSFKYKFLQRDLTNPDIKSEI